MSVGIKRLNKSGTTFDRAVHEKFYPIRLDACGNVFLGGGGLSQSFVDVHPTFNFIGCAQYEVHIAGVVHFLSGFVKVRVEEIS